MRNPATRWVSGGLAAIAVALALSGCVQLPVSGAQIAVLQDGDPRCGGKE